MEDKRIQRTKQNLKQAFVDLLQEEPFDRIKVTQLCEGAQISRITFYAHYGDKYELLEDLLQDLLKAATKGFERRQSQNNPEEDPRKSYSNMLDCILDLFQSHEDFLKQISQRRNPYLYYSFYQRVFQTVEQCIEMERDKLVPQVESRKFSIFLCNGLWAYINACYHEHEPLDTIRGETHTLLNGILYSQILRKKD